MLRKHIYKNLQMKKESNFCSEDWVNHFKGSLYNFTITRVNCKEDAEDILQETFLSAYKAKENFMGKSSVKTWLISILKNRIIDYYKSKRCNQIYQIYTNSTENIDEGSLFNYGNWSKRNNEFHINCISDEADYYLLKDEFYEVLNNSLQTLPDKMKHIFTAKYIHNKSSEEICREFNISMSNYWVVIYRAKILLRSCLEKQGIN